MLSVIVPISQEAELTIENCERELATCPIPYEIVLARDWNEGLKNAKGDYIIFLEEDCIFEEGSLLSSLDVFLSQPLFRKLAIVAPMVGINDWDDRVYGYNLGKDLIFPLKRPISYEPHLVQAVYLPGAIIRRNALVGLEPIFEKDTLNDSVNLSTKIWMSGSRCIVNTHAIYVTTHTEINKVRDMALPEMDNVRKLWKREMVG